MATEHTDGKGWRDARAAKPQAGRAAPFEGDGPAPRRARRAKGARQALAEPVVVVAAPPLAAAVEAALKEITTMPAAALHRAAALAWATRAVACYRVCLGKADLQEGLSYFYLGEHYREAALGHAALGEGWQPLHEEVDGAMAMDREDASAAMRRRSAAATP